MNPNMQLASEVMLVAEAQRGIGPRHYCEQPTTMAPSKRRRTAFCDQDFAPGFCTARAAALASLAPRPSSLDFRAVRFGADIVEHRS